MERERDSKEGVKAKLFLKIEGKVINRSWKEINNR